MNRTQAVLYYRLKQVDIDGTGSYSNIVPIHLSNTNVSFLVFPNPFKSDIRLQSTFATAGNIHLVVTDMNGKIASKQSLLVSEGFNDIPVKGLQNLAPGLYAIEIIQNGKIIFKTSLVKQ